MIQTLHYKEKGFTLVELAIVLVILGLLLGGVLKGYELTTNAKIKALSKDFEGIRTANYAFIDRKSTFPGQDSNTGQIANAVASADSVTDFFGELAAEGFLINQDIEPPKGLAVSYEVYYAADKATADTNNATLLAVNQVCATGLDGQIAKGLDAQFDDGEPETGHMRAETGVATAETSYEKGVKVTLCLELYRYHRPIFPCP